MPERLNENEYEMGVLRLAVLELHEKSGELLFLCVRTITKMKRRGRKHPRTKRFTTVKSLSQENSKRKSYVQPSDHSIGRLRILLRKRFWQSIQLYQ